MFVPKILHYLGFCFFWMLHSLIPREIEDNAFSAHFFGGKRCIVWDMQMADTKEFYQTNKKRELNLSTLVKGSPCS